MDMHSKAKGNVLKKLIGSMDDKMTTDLKKMSSKYKEDFEDLEHKSPVMKEKTEEDNFKEPKEMHETAEVKADVCESKSKESSSDEDDDDTRRLMEMYKKIK